MVARVRTDIPPYISLIPISGHFLPRMGMILDAEL